MPLMYRLALFLLLAAVSGAASAQSIFADDFETPHQGAILPGGSNYLWFGQAPGCGNDARDAYGLLARYDGLHPDGGTARATAQQQLAAMHATGMRRLSLGIYFMHQPAPGGTLIDSSDPQAVAHAASNLALLLADVKAAGYQEVLFRFFATNNINPSQQDFPGTGSSDYNARVDEYWNVIAAMRPVLAASGVSYRTDLMVEGAPRDSDPPVVSDPWKYPASDKWSKTVRTLWQRYKAAYGTNDTVGFSFLIDSDASRVRSRVRHMRYVYEGTYPPVFAADVYGTAQVDEFAKFTLLHNAMVSQNPSGAVWNITGWIIAEAYYDDPLAAERISAAIAATQRPVFYLTQWPLDRAGACLDSPEQVHVNVPPPYDWLSWRGYGF